MLCLTRFVSAPPEAVFEAWTHKEQAERWCCPDPNADVEITTDLQVGGRHSVRMHVEGGPFTARGVYRKIDPPHRLVYTWDWMEEPHAMGVDTLITVEFMAVEGGTEVRMTQEGFPLPDHEEGHKTGWSLCLERLAALFA